MSKETDDWLIELGKRIEEDEKIPGFVDKNRVEQVELVKKILEEIVYGHGISITSKVHSPSKSMGYIMVTGKQIIITDYEAFAKVCNIASIVDVCPKTDGNIEMEFTFHGLVRKG